MQERLNGNNVPFDELTSALRYHVIGGPGSDMYGGGDHQDSFVSSTGNDFYDGGADSDRMNYRTETGGVIVDLANGLVTKSGSGGTDHLYSFEFIVGSNFNDTFNAASFSSSSINAGSPVDISPLGTLSEFEGIGGNDTINGNGDTLSLIHI